jgi:hypothetical protein
LNEEGDTRIEIPNISLEHKVLFGLGGDLAFEVAKTLLRYRSGRLDTGDM